MSYRKFEIEKLIAKFVYILNTHKSINVEIEYSAINHMFQTTFIYVISYLNIIDLGSMKNNEKRFCSKKIIDSMKTVEFEEKWGVLRSALK